jgi:hypothetical protein
MNLRKAAENQPCTVCGANDGTTVLHHIRIGGNAGTGMKPPDFPWGIRLCAEHHRYVHYEGRADYKLIALAMGKQMQRYVDEGVLVIDENNGR